VAFVAEVPLLYRVSRIYRVMKERTTRETTDIQTMLTAYAVQAERAGSGVREYERCRAHAVRHAAHFTGFRQTF
jgi:hypothetical protein